MRRSEKEITDPNQISDLLKTATVMRLAMAQDNEPYLVPLSYGYDGDALFFHCAKDGRKVDFLRANSRVCFEVESGLRVNEHPTKPCAWGMHFQTVIGTGHARELVEMAEKQAALKCIMAQYSEQQWDFTDQAVEAVAVWKITVDEVTGKQG